MRAGRAVALLAVDRQVVLRVPVEGVGPVDAAVVVPEVVAATRAVGGVQPGVAQTAAAERVVVVVGARLRLRQVPVVVDAVGVLVGLDVTDAHALAVERREVRRVGRGGHGDDRAEIAVQRPVRDGAGEGSVGGHGHGARERPVDARALAAQVDLVARGAIGRARDRDGVARVTVAGVVEELPERRPGGRHRRGRDRGVRGSGDRESAAEHDGERGDAAPPWLDLGHGWSPRVGNGHSNTCRPIGTRA